MPVNSKSLHRRLLTATLRLAPQRAAPMQQEAHCDMAHASVHVNPTWPRTHHATSAEVHN
eukprot:6115898-Karenia_brevis.AAC.1